MTLVENISIDLMSSSISLLGQCSEIAEIISPTEYLDLLPDPDKEWLWYMYRAKELEIRIGMPSNSITLLQIAISKSKNSLVQEQLKSLLNTFILYQQTFQLLSESIYTNDHDHENIIQSEGWDINLMTALKKMSFKSFEKFMMNSNLSEFLDGIKDEKYLFWIGRILLTSKIDWPASIIEILVKVIEKIK